MVMPRSGESKRSLKIAQETAELLFHTEKGESLCVFHHFFGPPDRGMAILQILKFSSYSPGEELSNDTSLGSKFDCEFTDFPSNINVPHLSLLGRDSETSVPRG